jgi:hypothetical protein
MTTALEAVSKRYFCGATEDPARSTAESGSHMGGELRKPHIFSRLAFYSV